MTYSSFAHSYFAGQSNALVRLWWNPRPILTFLGIWGVSVWPFGVIQSTIAPFMLFVLSALELLAPFWIYQSNQMMRNWSTLGLTNSTTDITSSSDEDMRWSSRFGTIFNNSRNTAYSCLSLVWVSPIWIRKSSYGEYLLLAECLQTSFPQFCHDGHAIG